MTIYYTAVTVVINQAKSSTSRLQWIKYQTSSASSSAIVSLPTTNSNFYLKLHLGLPC